MTIELKTRHAMTVDVLFDKPIPESFAQNLVARLVQGAISAGARAGEAVPLKADIASAAAQTVETSERERAAFEAGWFTNAVHAPAHDLPGHLDRMRGALAIDFALFLSDRLGYAQKACLKLDADDAPIMDTDVTLTINLTEEDDTP